MPDIIESTRSFEYPSMELTQHESDYVKSVPREEAVRMLREVGFALRFENPDLYVVIKYGALAMENVVTVDGAQLDAGAQIFSGYSDACSYIGSINKLEWLQNQYPNAQALQEGVRT